MARSVKTRFSPGASQCFSYIVPPGDEPRVGDYVLVSTARSGAKARGVADNVKLIEILEIENPAHPKASKTYLARFTPTQLEDWQMCNEMRDAITNPARARLVAKPPSPSNPLGLPMWVDDPEETP